MAFNIIENELFDIIYNFVFFCFEVQAVQVQVDFLGFLMFQVVFLWSILIKFKTVLKFVVILS